MKSKKVIIIFACVAVLLIALTLWTVWGNTALELNSHTVTGKKVPTAFDGYRIAHVSDLHNAEMGEGNEKLLSMLRESKPDMIAITGDLIDSRRTDIDIALRFAEEAARIAPCYYVTGNHELRLNSAEYGRLKDGLEKAGVVILDNDRVIIEKDGEHIAVAGIPDSGFDLGEISKDSSEYTVLLAHRPERFNTYKESGVDLVLSGHAHGGQFRLPFVGGILSPSQGFFPKYDSGLYTQDNTAMVVSRGIGNSIFPFRLNNRPEVVLIELHRELF